MGLAALHLAVEWPRGMELLLQAGADVNCKDLSGRSPLVYAIEMSLVESIRLLALADCSLLDASLQLLLESAVVVELSAHRDGRRVTAAEMVVDLLVDVIVDRRQRLYDLAKSALPVSDLDQLCHDSYRPDDSASQLHSALQGHGITVPLALDLGRDRGTVFHQIGQSSRVAERLWKAGFRNIDGRDPFGRTPLMSLRHYRRPTGEIGSMLDYVAWLVEKGADFYAKRDLIFQSEARFLSTTALHFVAYDLGSFFELLTWIQLRNWAEENRSKSSKEMLQRILMDNDSDACMCACSISGCTTFVVFTKGYMGYRFTEYRYTEVSIVDLWPIVKDFCDPLKISEFVRIMTFEELGLTHTCCCKYLHGEGWKIKDKVEIDEIRDEEAEDLQKLEELLEEFEVKRKELDIPFEDFIKQYWAPRMKEVLEEGTLDEAALREIGVEVY